MERDNYFLIRKDDFKHQLVECSSMTTDDFDKWLTEHNKDRVADGCEIEEAHYFEVEECALSIFNKEEE